MSKFVKEMQMQVLRDTFQDTRDLVLINPGPLDAITENKLRLDLRKQDIRLMLVKNSLARKVFGEMGVELNDCWAGPTLLAWGGDSVAGLSKALQKTFKEHKAVEFKTALADGSQVTFEQATKMPTREEAIGRVVQLILSPGANLLAKIKGPGGQLAAQIKSIADEEKPPENG